jgi:hypothetical protein
MAARLNFSPSPFYPSPLVSHFSSTLHLLLVYLGGSAIMPSHIQRGVADDSSLCQAIS